MKDQQYEDWIASESLAGREYPTPSDAHAAYEAAGYRWINKDVMVHPTINLNGTSGKELFRQTQEVLDALREALNKIADAAPHGRDYQHDITGAVHRAAQAEHFNRVKMIHDLIRAYESQLEDIDNQMLEREAHRRRA